MRADSGFRGDGSNVPHGGISVNAGVCAAVAGCPARVVGLSLRVDPGTSTAEVAAVCEKLFRSHSRSSLCYQFCLGDAHEYTRPYSPERKDLTVIIDREMGPNYADRLRHFGSIAKRWPPDRRSEKLPWEYYKTHKPGMPGKPDVVIEKKRIRLEPVSVEVVGGVTMEVFEGRGNQQYEVVRAVQKAEVQS